MNIELDERRIADAAEAVNLAGLDHENVPGSRLELLAGDGPQAPAFSYELDLVVGMTMRSWPTARKRAQKEHRHVDVTLIDANELMRAAHKRQIVLTNTVHANPPPARYSTSGAEDICGYASRTSASDCDTNHRTRLNETT